MKKLLLLLFIPILSYGQDVTRTWDDTDLIIRNVTVEGVISGVSELEFSTVAQMKAFDFSQVADGARIKCNGYNVANDGLFGPDVFWDSTSTATDDGLSVFDPDASGNGRLERSFQGEISVRHAGAYGDGSTDDISAFNAVVSYIKNRTNSGGFYGGAVYIPIGDYILKEEWVFDRSTSGTAQAGGASTITLAADSSSDDNFFNQTYVHITSGTGIGQSAKILDYDGTTKVATISGTWTTNPDATSVYLVEGQINNIRLRGEGSTAGQGGTRLIWKPDTAQRGLVISSGWQISIEDIEFISGNSTVTKLIHLESKHSPIFSSYNMTFRHCAFRIFSGSSPTEEMMRIENTVQTEFYDCHFSGDDQKVVLGMEPDQTFDASSNVNTSTEEITITGHSFEENDPVTYAEGTGAIGGLTDTNGYLVRIVDANTIQLADATSDPVNLTSTGTGTATLTEQFEGGGGVGTLVFNECFYYWDTEVINSNQILYNNVVFGRKNPTTPVSIYPHATDFFRNNNVTFINSSQVSVTASPVDITFFEQGTNSTGLVVLNSRFDGYRTTFLINGKGNAVFDGNIYNPPSGFTANTIEGIVLGSNAEKVRIGTENFDGLTAIGAVPIDDNRSSPRWPLVVDEMLGSDHTFASVGNYEDIVTASSVILEGGLYRISWAMVVDNAGSTPSFIVRPTVDGAAIVSVSGYLEPAANAVTQITNSAIVRLNATETAVDIKLTVRQSAGTAATIKADSITYPAYLQFEKL